MIFFRYIAMATLLMVSPAFAACEISEQIDKVLNCPDDVKAFLEHRAICQHFGGEQTGGTSPQRDKQVYEAVEKHQCSRDTKQEFLTLVKKYRYTVTYSDMLKTLNNIDETYIVELFVQP